ncbi:hypothetical protein LOAG_13488 [Loa loa]|uniref:Uncharacterized protein n=1 Tax=Loa loa TaxID=7209 RepID=A0A1S0TJ75_LOALO|nr:hypothetical protein LOAG_13488 [Loa loa]EFO15027.1 hypothetical protein LOAG_13488 [Loa loa]
MNHAERELLTTVVGRFNDEEDPPSHRLAKLKNIRLVLTLRLSRSLLMSSVLSVRHSTNLFWKAGNFLERSYFLLLCRRLARIGGGWRKRLRQTTAQTKSYCGSATPSHRRRQERHMQTEWILPHPPMVHFVCPSHLSGFSQLTN